MELMELMEITMKTKETRMKIVITILRNIFLLILPLEFSEQTNLSRKDGNDYEFISLSIFPQILFTNLVFFNKN